jgi:hypothetical protein
MLSGVTAVESSLDSARQLMDEERIGEAIDVPAAGAETSAALLARHALLEERRDRPTAALACWAEAQRLAPGDLDYVVGRVRLL